MNIQLKYLRVRRVWAELYASKYILIYAGSQLVIMFSGLVRMRFMSDDMSADSIGVWLFWVSALAWGAVLGAATGNAARLKARDPDSQTSDIVVPARLFKTLVLVGLGLTAFGIPTQDHYFWASAGPAILTMAAMLFLSPFVGFQQGRGQGHEQFISNALSSLFFFVLTWAICALPWWQAQTSSVQIYVMTMISCASMLGPFVWAWFRQRSETALTRILGQNVSARGMLLDTAAVLPPAFISGFDAIALQFTGHQESLGSYGVASRLLLIVTLVPSAIYVQVFNHLGGRNGTDITGIARLTALLIAANAPFVGLYIAFGKPLAQYLSHDKIAISNSQLIATAIIAFLLPVWICASGAILASESMRADLGKHIIRAVIPGSILLTFGFSFAFATPGPMYASIVTYIICTAFAYHILQRNVQKNQIVEIAMPMRGDS